MAEHGRYHTERYYLSLDEGHFGECPIDRCPESSTESKIRKKEKANQPIEEGGETEQSKLPV